MTIELMNPCGEFSHTETPLAPRRGLADGSTVGLFHNSKKNADLLLDDLQGLLDRRHDGLKFLRFRKEAAACIVLASEGYPEKPIKGDVITGIETAAAQEGVEIFHAGTAVKDGQLVAAGGRVLNVCASGATLRDALKRAYTAAAAIRWESKILRHDIGRRVLNRVSA